MIEFTSDVGRLTGIFCVMLRCAGTSQNAMDHTSWDIGDQRLGFV
jgi:hypothetical protein